MKNHRFYLLEKDIEVSTSTLLHKGYVDLPDVSQDNLKKPFKKRLIIDVKNKSFWITFGDKAFELTTKHIVGSFKEELVQTTLTEINKL